MALYYFWGVGCPVCARQQPFLEELERAYPGLEVRAYEVYHDAESRTLFQDMARAAGFEPTGVPTTFIGERYWVGFSEQVAEQMRAQVDLCSRVGCPDAGAGLVLDESEPRPLLPPVAEDSPEAQGEMAAATPSSEITLPLLGVVDLGARSLTVSTALIAFVDGFNPCSLWVLSILLSLILHTRSRKRVFAVGMTFLLVTTTIYALFIAGLFTVFSFVSYMGWIQILVALIALLFAAINIKDYFWYQEGVSLTISDDQRPGLYRKMRSIMQAESMGAMVAATVLMAAGVALIELPCTAGLPMLWTGLVASQGVSGQTFGLLLALYMLIFLVDELALFSVAVVTLRTSKLQEKHGRILKLVGGVLMLTIALAMLFEPAAMGDVGSTLVVFGLALAATLLVIVTHRIVLPRFGVYIGSEIGAPHKRRRGRTVRQSRRRTG